MCILVCVKGNEVKIFFLLLGALLLTYGIVLSYWGDGFVIALLPTNTLLVILGSVPLIAGGAITGRVFVDRSRGSINLLRPHKKWSRVVVADNISSITLDRQTNLPDPNYNENSGLFVENIFTFILMLLALRSTAKQQQRDERVILLVRSTKGLYFAPEKNLKNPEFVRDVLSLLQQNSHIRIPDHDKVALGRLS